MARTFAEIAFTDSVKVAHCVSGTIYMRLAVLRDVLAAEVRLLGGYRLNRMRR